VADTYTSVSLEVNGNGIIEEGDVGSEPIVSDPINLQPGWHDVLFRVRGTRGPVKAKLFFHESCPELAGQPVPASFFTGNLTFEVD